MNFVSKHRFAYAWLALLSASLLGFPSCSKSESGSQAQSNVGPSADVQKLAKLINLVETPESVLFTLSPMGKGDGIFGPKDYNLVAVLHYDRSSLERLKLRATRLSADVRSIRVPGRQEWFPAPILTAIKRCPNSWCIDGEEYSGTEFLKGGFVSGYFVVPADQQFVILRLGT